MLARAGIVDIQQIYARYPLPSTLPAGFLERMGYRPVADLPGGDAGFAVWRADFGPSGILGFLRDTVLAEQGFAVGPASAAGLLEPVDAAGRERLARAIDAAFGDSAADRRLRQVLELAHLHPDVGEAGALARLHVSRATYYRMLRRARERVLAAG